MNDSRLYTECESLAARLGIVIRYVSGGPVGICKIRGKHVIFLETNMDNNKKIDIFIRAFQTLDLEGFFIIPAIRDKIDGEDK